MSVLGLRKFKEELTSIEINPETINAEQFWNDYGFSVEGFEVNMNGTNVTVLGLACLLYFPSQEAYGMPTKIDTGDYGVIYYNATLDDIENWGIGTFNVISTANSTVDAWLLANTEAVGETEDTIYTEKSSWYKSVADAIRNKKGTSAPILRDDFAREIESISVGEALEEYDGTVIIEKAESVLGLRRFKESIIPFGDLAGDDVFDEEFSTIKYNENYFTIAPVSDDKSIIHGLTPIYNINGSDFFYVDYEETVLDYRIITPAPALNIVENLGTFNVLSTANSRVDEWLLANTEGVSV
jgi:hypothetical protein